MIRPGLVLFLMLTSVPAAASVTLTGTLPRKDGRALTDLPGLETRYGEVRTTEGIRLRTILTRPAGSSGRLPMILLTQWVSCGSLDFRAERQNQLRDIAERSGMVLARVERRGTGDSEGAPCSALDFDTEVRHYREALDALAKHEWVDGSRIILYGSSLGSTTAPLVAQGKAVAGIAIQGGGALTHLERMINFERLYLERSGKVRPEQIAREMNRRTAFLVDYLVRGRTPEQIERERPELRGVWANMRGTAEAPPHYGRPYTWHQQAARANFLAAWIEVTAPVLVVYGEYDQFEMEHGHRLIADVRNRLRPGSATYVRVPRADHELDLYASPEDAYAYRNPTVRRELFVDPFLSWAKSVTNKSGSEAASAAVER